MTAFWMRNGRRGTSLLWMIAAWFFAGSNAGFVARYWYSFLPTTLVAGGAATLGHIALFLGVVHFIRTKLIWKTAAALVVSHLLSMSCIVILDAPAQARMLLNSIFWAGITSAALSYFVHSAFQTWRDRFAFPVFVLALHAIFHLVRVGIVYLDLSGVSSLSLHTLQSISFTESSLFTVLLFMSLLISDLRERNRQLQSAVDEVQTLSGMLPICSSCKKIRDDAGYWTRLETYICHRSGAQFSHGLCPECAVSLYPDVFGKDSVADPKAASVPGKTLNTPLPSVIQ